MLFLSSRNGLMWIALGWLAAPLAAQETADYFRQNCASCHTIGGGRLTGPDLKGVTQRKERDWLIRFLLDPKGMIDSGDPYAQQLLQEARGVIMPTPFGMTPARAAALLDLIEAESQKEHSSFAGVQIVERPLTAAEAARGRAIFLGFQRLAQGGPPCFSCHRAGNWQALGGGQLGPDLARVYEHLQGRKELIAWLSAPPTPTMQAVYKQHPLQSEEILALVAFLEELAKQESTTPEASTLNFFLLGLGGAVAGLVVFDWLWRQRFRGIRRSLLASRISRGAA
jgi:mono/diheme cytochrome c family protein